LGVKPTVNIWRR